MIAPEKGEVKTLPELLNWRVNRTPQKLCYKFKKEDRWFEVSWKEYYEKVKLLSMALMELGLEKGDRVGILGETRPEWVICDFAVIMGGGISVGIYQTLSPEQIEFILNDSSSRFLFVENDEQLGKVLRIRENLRYLKKVIVWDGGGYDDEWVIGLEECVEKYGKKIKDEDFERRWKSVEPEDVAIILYTSGTTGPPKGAMLTNRNIISLLECWKDKIDIRDDDITLSFLPMAHGAEHVVGFLGRLNVGMPTAYARSIKTVLEDIQDVKPTVFGSVPRIFEKAYSAIHGEINKRGKIVQKLFRWAVRTGKEYSKFIREKKPIPVLLKFKYLIADLLIFRKIRAFFGGRVRFFISGAAPISVEILEFFHAMGLLILEVYGLTEATVITHANTIDDYKFGMVGKPIDILECKIAPDGEVLVRGPTVFKGYWNNPKATSEIIDEEGWLHTGDIGEVDENGFLKITDRKKHIIVTSGGKNISPANIENTIKSLDPIISQVHVHGDRRPYLTALITLDEAEVKKFFERKGLNYVNFESALREASLKERVREIVMAANEKVSRVEWVRKFKVLPRDFSIESGEITPTLKIKRREIEYKFKDVFDRMYDGSEPDVIEVVGSEGI